jgi:hypothetical protein
MSKYSRQIIGVLQDTEKRALALISDAARDADLDGVEMAHAVARHVRKLIESLSGTDSQQQNSSNALDGGREPGHAFRSKQKTRKGEYPRFCVREGVLRRIGWSKKGKREYEHKVPKDVFASAVKAAASVGATAHGPVTAEEIMERVTDAAGVPVPSYQVYVVIGLLKQKGCIEQVGREGYVIPNDIDTRAHALWADLVESAGRSQE